MASNFSHVKKGLALDNTQTASLVSANGDVSYNATSNKIEFYNGAVDSVVGEATTATLTNKTLTTPVISTISNTGTLTLPTTTDTLVGRATTDTLTNKTLTAPVISSIVNSGTLTLPTSTDTLVGKATTDTFTNKSISGSTNTITNVSLTTGVTGILPIANGGSGQSTKAGGFDALSPMTTLGDVIYGGASGTGTRLGIGANGQVLTVVSGSPAWGSGISALVPQITQYKYRQITFTVTAANATAGAVYSITGSPTATYEVVTTIVGGTSLVTNKTWTNNGSSSITTLTKVSGSGDTVITVSAAVDSGSYTAPVGALYLKVRVQAGGGSGGSGVAGSNSAFGTGGSQVLASGGSGGSGTAGGTGGGYSLGTNSGWGVTGGSGNNSTTSNQGGAGGNGYHGGGGKGGGGTGGGTNTAGTLNSGGGGGGAAGVGGGGAGGYAEALITSPSGSYTITVGEGGIGSGGFVNVNDGGNGQVVVEAHFQ